MQYGEKLPTVHVLLSAQLKSQTDKYKKMDKLSKKDREFLNVVTSHTALKNKLC